MKFLARLAPARHPADGPFPSWAVLAAAAALATGLAGCAVAPTSHRPPAHKVPTTTTVELALEAAARFMNDMVSGDYSRQWAELAPTGQAQWPSEASRSAALATKFSGPARVVSFTLGSPETGAVWYSRENPSVHVSGAISIPVSVGFQRAASIEPLGAAADYQDLRLVLVPSGRGRSATSMKVVGQGPASIDAPVINPVTVDQRSASVPVLMYHLVGPYPNRSDYTSNYSYQIDYGLTVPPAQFTSEMGYLVQNGYTSISLVRLADNLLYGLPLPPKPVVITFDDGFANEYQYALPVLTQDRLTATFLPCSGLIGIKNGQEYYMTAAELQDLATHGFWVEDHTYNDGTVLWGQSDSEMQFLAGQTAQVLMGITGYPIQFISYSGLWTAPSPQTASPSQTALFSQLAGLGYVGGLEDNWVGRFAWSETSSDLWEMPRVRAYPGESTAEFGALLNYG
ncbi:MAG: polysaccharide deacetylase family protein [Candidatus Dormibacteraeota bacterium]|nr:polysaccharide deacetylase family protein [Candidatus Dormibacteraeota bacterium]